jgi:hypothetical protein
MVLPETFLIQCRCGTIIKLEDSRLLGRSEIDDALKSQDFLSELSAMIREQLCKCEHMLFVHDKSQAKRPCMKLGCDCVLFRVSNWPKQEAVLKKRK